MRAAPFPGAALFCCPAPPRHSPIRQAKRHSPQKQSPQHRKKRTKKALDIAAYKGFAGETCSFLRVLEGTDLPKPEFGVSTSQPCQQGERIFQDIARQYNFSDRFYSLHTPINAEDPNSVEQIAEGLEEAVVLMEKALGMKMDMGRLAEACRLSNEAAEISKKCNELRWSSPPLIRGAEGVYNAVLFSQLWGKKELVDIQKQFYEDLCIKKEWAEKHYRREDTHRLLWLHLPPFYDTKILDFIELTCRAPQTAHSGISRPEIEGELHQFQRGKIRIERLHSL